MKARKLNEHIYEIKCDKNIIKQEKLSKKPRMTPKIKLAISFQHFSEKS